MLSMFYKTGFMKTFVIYIVVMPMLRNYNLVQTEFSDEHHDNVEHNKSK